MFCGGKPPRQWLLMPPPFSYTSVRPFPGAGWKSSFIPFTKMIFSSLAMGASLPALTRGSDDTTRHPPEHQGFKGYEARVRKGSLPDSMLRARRMREPKSLNVKCAWSKNIHPCYLQCMFSIQSNGLGRRREKTFGWSLCLLKLWWMTAFWCSVFWPLVFVWVSGLH